MSYQVLARKWRPQRFDEVAGQAHVTTALRNAIRFGRVPHALLLTGPRGVGKTTLARLLARCLNCEKGPTDTPCGECASCREIASGSSTDVQEIDAASRTSVDDVRELIEAIRYAPSPGKHRIFVVDEVHMLSTPAFNALLKTLEEPPPRSLFVFATTNPEKIPLTVVSRCQRHDLRRLSSEEIAARLREIVAAEKIEISPSSLLAVARAGDGSLRDAQTLLDQLVSTAGSKVDDATVASVLDLIDRRLVLAILEACIDAAPARAIEACARAATSGIDPRRLAGELLQGLRDLVVLRVAPDASGLIDANDADRDALRALASRVEEARLRRMFRALLREQEDLAWAPQPTAVLEMAVVRLACMAPGDDVAQLLARLDALERRLSAEGGPPRGAPGGAAPPPAGGSRGSPSRRPGGATAAPAPDVASADSGRSTPNGVDLAEVQDDDAREGLAPHDGASPAVVFDRLRGFVAESGQPGLAAAMEGGSLLEVRPGSLRLAATAGFPASRLEQRREILEGIASRFFGRPTKLAIEPLGVAPAPAKTAAPDLEQARSLRQEALQDPGVNAAMEILRADIVEIRVLGARP